MINVTDFDNKLHKILRFIMIIFFTNSLFMLSNILLIFSLLFIPIGIENVLVFVILFFHLGPGITAMSYVNRKYMLEKDFRVWRNYWHSYKQNFFISLKSFSITSIVLTVFIFNLVYVKSNLNIPQIIVLPIILFIGLLLALIVCQSVILSRFNVRTSTLLILTFVTCLKEWSITIKIIGISILFVSGIFILPMSIICTMWFSLYSYLNLYFLQPILVHLEENTVVET